MASTTSTPHARALWPPARLALRSTRLDFRSAGLGRREGHELLADDLVLANAVELVSSPADAIQTVLCAQCGQEGCEDGGWLSPRSAGDYVLLLPCFRLLDESARFAPPAAVISRGVPILGPDRAAQLACLAPRIAMLAASAPVTGSELAGLLVWIAPDGALREGTDALVAVSTGELTDARARLHMLLARARGDHAPRRLTPRAPDEHEVTFFLDLPGYPAWTPLVMGADDLPHLCVGDLVVR